VSLSPIEESPITFTEGEGGSYYVWNSSNFPYLGVAEISAAILILKPFGFAFPHYADCNKIGYVVEGREGIAGIIDPITSEEKVVKLKKGDAIVVPGGAVSWWLNAGEDDLKFIYLGQSVKDRGVLTYSILTGPVGILKAFPAKTICKAVDINQEQANILTNSQKLAFILKLEEAKTIQNLSKESHTKALCFNFDENKADIEVKNGGSFIKLTNEMHSPLEGIEISGSFLKLDPNAMFGPTYYGRDSGVQLSYVVKGSGWVHVLSMTGQIVLDIELKAGQIFAVPKLYLVSIGAGDEGIECFSIVNTSKPILCEMTGKTSVWSVLSPQVLQASLNISPEFCQVFKEKINKSSIISPAL